MQQKTSYLLQFLALISLSLDAFSWDSDFHLDLEIHLDLNYAQDSHDHDLALWMAVAHGQDNYILVDSHRLVADNHIQVDNIHKVMDSHRLVEDT